MALFKGGGFLSPHTHTKGERKNENIKEYISANIQKVKIDIEEAAAVPTASSSFFFFQNKKSKQFMKRHIQ